MALRAEQKRATVSALADIANRSQILVVADPTGMDAQAMDALRRHARTQNVAVRMAMNTMARRAFVETGYACVLDALSGPSLFVFSMHPDEPGAAARVLGEFAAADKDSGPQIKLIAMGGQLLGAQRARQVAKLPNKSAAIAQLLSVMLAPVGQLAAVLGALPAQCVRVLAAVAERKRSG